MRTSVGPENETITTNHNFHHLNDRPELKIYRASIELQKQIYRFRFIMISLLFTDNYGTKHVFTMSLRFIKVLKSAVVRL